MERIVTRIAGACALWASLAGTARAQSAEPPAPGRGGLPGITGTAVDSRPRPPEPDRNVPTPEGDVETAGEERSGPSEPTSAGGRDKRRGEGRGVDEQRLGDVRAVVDRGLPKARAKRLKVYNRDGRAHISGTVRSEAEKEALLRRVHQFVSPEEAVIDVEVRPEGGP